MDKNQASDVISELKKIRRLLEEIKAIADDTNRSVAELYEEK